MQRHPWTVIVFISFILAACRNATPSATPVPDASSSPLPTATDVPSVATEIGHETFTLTGEQAQEIALFMDFIHAYNSGRLDDALALLSVNISGSDCDYREIKTILFHGKSQATEWLRNRLSEHDRLQVSRISDENPDASGAHVIVVEYSRRSSSVLEGLGFSQGITPKLAAKVIFGVAPTLINEFANGPSGGDPKVCRPGD